MAKGIAHLGVLFSLIIHTGHVNAILISDLLISEVMADPAALPDARGEWFELYNPTDQEINLRDTWIGDDGRDLHKIETDLLILPSEYLTLARSDDPGFTPGYVYDNFTLGNGADEIVLSDGLMELLRIDYSAGFVEAGRSSELMRLPMLASNYDLTLASLSYGLDDVGTPGAEGSTSLAVSAVPLPAAAWLFITGILAVLSPTVLSRHAPTVRGFPIDIPRLDPMRRAGGTQYS